MEEIKVTIDAEGNVKVTVFGVKGGKCLELTKELEQLLDDAHQELAQRQQSWNNDQQNAVTTNNLPTLPEGLRAPVSVAAIISSSSASVAIDLSTCSTIEVSP